jgi:hypothetical protein
LLGFASLHILANNYQPLKWALGKSQAMDDNSLEQRILRKADYFNKRLKVKVDPIINHKKFVIFEWLLIMSPVWFPILLPFIMRLIFGGGRTDLSFVALSLIAVSYIVGVFALFRITKSDLYNRILNLFIYFICMLFPAFFAGWFCLGMLIIK